MSALPQVTPAWTALTAYLVGARVAPVVANGLNWYATVGGTSGAAEPTWPVADPWTVTDGSVTWRLATSFRQLAVAGMTSALTSFRLANPTLLKGIAGARPANLTLLDLPGAWVDAADETIVHASGVRTRTITGQVMVVIQAPANNESSAASDVIVDGLMDAFTAAYHVADGSSEIVPVSVAEVPLDTDGGHYLGELISFRITKPEGRN